MEIHKLTASLNVTGQVEEGDVEALAAAGFKCVICNRPDSEGGTPSHRIRAACERNGLKFFMLPVDYAALGVADGDAFGAILQQCEQPTLAYCRTGRRSTGLWAIAAAPLAGVQAALERAARVGLSVDELRAVLTRSAARTDPPYAPGSDPARRERFVRLWVAPPAGRGSSA